MGMNFKKKIMADFTTSCSCSECIEMCKRRPCRGTPKQVRKFLLKNPQLANKFTFDKIKCGSDTMLISPRIKNQERNYIGSFEHGECIFLDNQSLCEIHEQKFIEGKLCNHDWHDEDYERMDKLYKTFERKWKSVQGHKVIKLYEKLTNNKLEDVWPPKYRRD